MVGELSSRWLRWRLLLRCAQCGACHACPSLVEGSNLLLIHVLSKRLLCTYNVVLRGSPTDRHTRFAPLQSSQCLKVGGRC